MVVFTGYISFVFHEYRFIILCTKWSRGKLTAGDVQDQCKNGRTAHWLNALQEQGLGYQPADANLDDTIHLTVPWVNRDEEQTPYFHPVSHSTGTILS